MGINNWSYEECSNFIEDLKNLRANILSIRNSVTNEINSLDSRISDHYRSNYSFETDVIKNLDDAIDYLRDYITIIIEKNETAKSLEDNFMNSLSDGTNGSWNSKYSGVSTEASGSYNSGIGDWNNQKYNNGPGTNANGGTNGWDNAAGSGTTDGTIDAWSEKNKKGVNGEYGYLPSETDSWNGTIDPWSGSQGYNNYNGNNGYTGTGNYTGGTGSWNGTIDPWNGNSSYGGYTPSGNYTGNNGYTGTGSYTGGTGSWNGTVNPWDGNSSYGGYTPSGSYTGTSGTTGSHGGVAGINGATGGTNGTSGDWSDGSLWNTGNDLKNRVIDPWGGSGSGSTGKNGSWDGTGNSFGTGNGSGLSRGAASAVAAAGIGSKTGTNGSSSLNTKSGSNVTTSESSKLGKTGVLDILGKGVSKMAASIAPGSVSDTNSAGTKAGMLAGAGLAMGGAAAAAAGYIIAKKNHFYTFTPDDWEDLDKITQKTILDDFVGAGFNEAEIETFKNSTFKILAIELDEHIKKIEEAYDNNENLEVEIKEMYGFSLFDDSDKLIKYCLFIMMIIDGKNSIDTYNLYNIVNQALSDTEEADFTYAGIDMEEYIYDEDQDDDDDDDENDNQEKVGNSIDAIDKEWLSGIGLD